MRNTLNQLSSSDGLAVTARLTSCSLMSRPRKVHYALALPQRMALATTPELQDFRSDELALE